MAYGNHPSNHNETDARRELERIFSTLENDVHIHLFIAPKKNEPYNDLARQILSLFEKVSGKIIVEQHDLKDPLAREWDVSYSPTIIFEPDRYNIRWIGAPAGEEGRTFVELLLLIGYGKSNLSTESEGVLKRINETRNLKVFVSPSCPYCPQQAVNAIKAAVAKPDVISLEIIDIQAHPDIADQYGAQSVPQTFANDMLIALGAQQEELFMASLDKMEQQTVFIPESDAELVETDVVIVGGGPAGLTAGIYAARSGLNAVVLERNALGGQVATTPVVENYPGMAEVGGKTLVDVMVSHALEYVQIFQGEEVQEVSQEEKFTILTNRRKFIAKAILLATGAVYRKLGVPGEDRLSGRGVSYCSTCDGPLFKNKKVIMVGGGDSAATEALHLKNIGVDITIIHWLDALEAQDYLAKQLKENNIPIFYNTEVKEIKGEQRVQQVALYNNKTEEKTTMDVNGVFIAIGYIPAVDLAEKIGVELTPDGFIKQDHYRTNIPGIYAAGDATGGYNQIVIASGHGSGAALTIFEDLIHPFWKKEKD